MKAKLLAFLLASLFMSPTLHSAGFSPQPLGQPNLIPFTIKKISHPWISVFKSKINLITIKKESETKKERTPQFGPDSRNFPQKGKTELNSILEEIRFFQHVETQA